MKYILTFIFTIASFHSIQAQTTKILFDASKAESAGSADWVIDAGSHNLGFNNGPAVINSGSESNPARYPSPPQSGVTSTTAENFWEGGISYLGIDCAKLGYSVETLPYNGQITYGNTGNVQDLSNYKVFVVCEPNIPFTSTEKTALLNFVQNGGGLFMISDHTGSDRNNDGFDSPYIWNDFMDTNAVAVNPFGITFDYANISQTSTNVTISSSNPIINGSFGNVTQVKWSNGTTMSLSTAANNSVKGSVWKSGSAQSGTNVLMATSKYGTGKIAAIGDSSPFDDGTGDPGDQLYDGYITDAAGNHQKLIMNTIIWLATSTTGINESSASDLQMHVYPQPATEFVNVFIPSTLQEKSELFLADINGKIVWKKSVTVNENEITIPTTAFLPGLYTLVHTLEQRITTTRLMIVH